MVGDAVIDLVTDEPDFMITTPAGNVGKMIGSDHGACWISWRGDHQARQRRGCVHLVQHRH